MKTNRLPNFFLLGAAKSGTTTLFEILRGHSQVYLSFEKEPMFFSRDEYFNRGMDWYVQTFFTGGADLPIRGEASPHYLYWAEKVAPRISESLSKQPLKMVAIFRNPIDRAYSWYWNMLAESREDLPFLQAVIREEQRLQGNWDELRGAGSMQYGYVLGGRYATQVKAFLRFFQREQFLFLLYDDLLRDQSAIAKELIDFLGIDESYAPKTIKSNPSGVPRSRYLHAWLVKPSPFKEPFKKLIPYRLRRPLKNTALNLNRRRYGYPPMEPEAHSYLTSRLEGEIAELSRIIGRDLSPWLSPQPDRSG